MKTKELEKQKNIDLEPFYQAIEDDPRLLEETFEIFLELINSDPKSIKNVALLIKKDFRQLYNEIAELCKSNQDKGNNISCCGGD